MASITQPVEILSFKGQFGPIRADPQDPLIIDILPLTVFIGPQGSGKSLTSQVLHFFRDVDYLLAKYSTEYDSSEDAVRNIMEWLRAGSRGSRGSFSRRDLSAFVPQKTARLEWGEAITGQNGNDKTSFSRGISISGDTHKIMPISQFKKRIDEFLKELKKTPSNRLKYSRHALFIPAERLMYARLVNVAPGVLSDTYMPLTMVEMADAMSQAREIWQDWQASRRPMPAEARRIEEIVASVLSGTPKYEEKGPLANTWQWIPDVSPSGQNRSLPKTTKAIQIEMASSGQMSIWPLVLMLQAVFDQEEGVRPKYIHIEEPESHLHPHAQQAVARIIGYLINQGFHIIVSTHSLAMVYALNNLIMAHQTFGTEKGVSDFPSPDVRISPEQVSAYLFHNQTIENINDPENKQVIERRLGEIMGEMEIEYNKMRFYPGSSNAAPETT